MLLRSGAHRQDTPGLTVVAASPDTPGRERWQWQAAVVEGAGEVPGIPADAEVVTVALGRALFGDTPAVLHVAADTTQAVPSVDRVEVDGPRQLSRGREEVMLLLVEHGAVLVEGRHRLAGGDVLILEGDDPFELTVDAAANGAPAQGPSGCCVVRLAAPEGGRLGWVP